MPRIILYIILDFLRSKALPKGIMPVWNILNAEDMYAKDIVFKTKSTIFVKNNA